jgi:SAM-dependent methyltransferase
MIGPVLWLARAARWTAYKALGRRPANGGFILPREEWVRSHFLVVPRETVAFSGPVAGTAMLNVGCGEMLTDFGFLRFGVGRITALDVEAKPESCLEEVAARLRAAGYRASGDWPARLAYCRYDGRTFPFPNDSFDFVFSWSAFEHIEDVPGALAEIRRVVRADGRVFIQVDPWFPSFHGSHLTDYVSEPFFHLRRSPEWIRQQLEAWAAGHPDRKEFVLTYMWREFQHLNGYSASRFLEAVRQTGFTVTRCRLIIRDEDLSHVPASVPLADAMVAGLMVLLKKR